MARTKDPTIRTMLIERAALLLRRRNPVTIRSLVDGTGVSTMAVYTYFGGMDGLWKAMRQEGFTRLAEKLQAVTTSPDPVCDLTALGAAYLSNALANPDLYRVMFDAGFELEDTKAADDTLYSLVTAIERAKAVGRFHPDVEPHRLATQSWIIGHGLASLIVTGPLSEPALANGIGLLSALFISAGDDPRLCRESVERGWRPTRPVYPQANVGAADLRHRPGLGAG